MKQVHIIGGGISGLSVGYFLAQAGVPVQIFEKSDRLGGLIDTRLMDWGYVETAANGFLNSPLVESVFADLVIEKAPRPEGAKARYIFRNKAASRWPLTPFETARLMMGFAKYATQQKNREAKKNETVEEYIMRVFGRATFDFIAGPGLQGIYGTQDLDAELILRNIRTNQQGNKRNRGGTVAPKGGMNELITKMAQSIKSHGGEIHLQANGDLRLSHPTVIATSAPAAALVLLPEREHIARVLMRIEYLPLTTVTIALKSEAKQLPGFGCLFAKNENMQALGVLFNHNIFSRVPQNITETWIFSEASMSDEVAREKMSSDRRQLMGVDDKIESLHVTAWPHALPHYNQALREAIDSILLPNQIYLAGNYLGQIGLSRMLENHRNLAEKIKSEL